MPCKVYIIVAFLQVFLIHAKVTQMEIKAEYFHTPVYIGNLGSLSQIEEYALWFLYIWHTVLFLFSYGEIIEYVRGDLHPNQV